MPFIPRYIIVSAWDNEEDSVSVFSLDEEEDCYSSWSACGDDSSKEEASELAESDHTVLPHINGDTKVCSRLPRVPQRQQSFSELFLDDDEESLVQEGSSFEILLKAPVSPVSCASTLNLSSSADPPRAPLRRGSIIFSLEELDLSPDSPSESGDTTATIVPSVSVDKPLRKPMRRGEQDDLLSSRTAFCNNCNTPEQICVCPKAA